MPPPQTADRKKPEETLEERLDRLKQLVKGEKEETPSSKDEDEQPHKEKEYWWQKGQYA